MKFEKTVVKHNRTFKPWGIKKELILLKELGKINNYLTKRSAVYQKHSLTIHM